MSDADKLANIVLENEEEPAPTPQPGPAERAEAGEDISKMSTVDKWKGALETFRKLREAERKKAATMEQLEFALHYRHQLAIHGLDPDKDVANTIRRSEQFRGYHQNMSWKRRLKEKGDPNWQEASERDIVGVRTKAGETVLFDEWIKPPPPREK